MAIKVVKAAGSAPELQIYGDIVDSAWYNDEVTAKNISEQLKALGDVPEITVRINSYGGSVFAGQAIHSMLRNNKANVTVYVDGIAASIASVIAMAGNKVIMPSNAMLMIHNPWSWTVGNAEDMRKTADDLDKIRESLVAAYQNKCPLSREEIIAIMDEETWLTASEALEMGFIDEIADSMPMAASISDGFASFNGVKIGTEKLSAKALNAISTIAGKSAALPPPVAQTPQKEGKSMDKETLKSQHPELFAAVNDDAFNAGVEAERSRIKAIEELGVKGHDQLVVNAKFNAPMSVEALAFAVVNAEKSQRQSYLANADADAGELNGTVAAEDTPSGSETQKHEDQGAFAKMANAFNSAVNRRRN